MTDKSSTFEALSLQRWEVPESMISRYRVYRDAQNYQIVEAPTASDALKESGITKAYRIERDIALKNTVLDSKKLSTMPAAANKPAAEKPVEQAPIAEVKAPIEETPPPAAIADSELSPEQVNALLQGQPGA